MLLRTIYFLFSYINPFSNRPILIFGAPLHPIASDHLHRLAKQSMLSAVQLYSQSVIQSISPRCFRKGAFYLFILPAA